MQNPRIRLNHSDSIYETYFDSQKSELKMWLTVLHLLQLQPLTSLFYHCKAAKRDEMRGKRRRSTSTTAISATTSAWQVTLFDLGKQLNKQRTLVERMADDIKHMRKQFNQVQRDLAKFEKRMEKMKTASSTTRRGKRRE